MAYLLDLIAIIFIVILSFFFCMSNDNIKNNTNKSSCLLSHIIVGLSVIVFYKLAKHFKINDKLNNNYSINTKYTSNSDNKEQFTDSVTESINDFIKGTNTEIINSQQASSLTPAQLQIYSNKIDALNNNISNLQSSIKSPDALSNSNPSKLSTLDLSAQQQYQMFQIDYLNKQIKNAQDVINSQSISESTTNYKPIKVFSSCIVSNANGTTTNESSVSKSSSGDLQLTSNSKSPSTEQMLRTIGQSNSQTQGPILSPQTGVFQSVFSNIPKFDSINIS
jgi:hypothetical protein